MRLQLSLSSEELDAVTTYCARRVFPTMADLRGFTDSERIKVGGWLDAEAVVARGRGQMGRRGRFVNTVPMVFAQTRTKCMREATFYASVQHLVQGSNGGQLRGCP